MIKLNAAQEDKAKSLLLDIWIRARQTANTRAEEYTNWTKYGYSILSSTHDTVGTAAALTIMQAITRRTFNFKEVDTALERLKDNRVSFGNSTKSTTCEWSIKNTAGAAKFLAWICQQNRIYWNDTAYTPSEREAFKTGSVFGYYLYEAECFVSQPSRAARTRTASTRAAGSSGGSSAPKSGYKSAGPQSAYVAGLLSEPGKKETISSSVIFCITGEKAGTIIPKAFIHPVENSAVGERAKLNADGLPVVKFGAGNGYTDLAIFHPDKAVMDSIFASMESKGLFSKYSGVSVRKTNNDGGGFFRVQSECGEVYVKTTKLNEKLFEDTFAEMIPVAEEEPLIESGPVILNMDQFVRDSKMYD